LISVLNGTSGAGSRSNTSLPGTSGLLATQFHGCKFERRDLRGGHQPLDAIDLQVWLCDRRVP